MCLALSSLETEAFPFMFAKPSLLSINLTAKEGQTEKGREVGLGKYDKESRVAQQIKRETIGDAGRTVWDGMGRGKHGKSMLSCHSSFY